MTSEQLEAARAERMRQNGIGALTLEDARTWMEETGLCLFLPKKQAAPSLAPSFVEAVAGERNQTPEPKQIALAEELLVRLELDGVAVRLNLQGLPGEQPDYIVAAWVLPYVYALRGDRDWRRVPQLTGSRAVSPLAVQVYKHLEQREMTVSELKQVLGQGPSDVAVVRAITELWQQLRILPVIAAPGKAARWQLLKIRFQKAIAEGASTSQVTAISVLASIFLQAVIAASMEEVELFLQPLTARSKIREVLRGLVATRQVHTLSMGHAPHFYVAGTLPEFSVAPQIYASGTLSGYGARYSFSYSAGGYFGREDELEDSHEEPAHHSGSHNSGAHKPAAHEEKAHTNGSHNGAAAEKHTDRNGDRNGSVRAQFSRNGSHGSSTNGSHSHDRKPAAANGTRHSSEGRTAKPAAGKSASGRPGGSLNARGGRTSSARPASATRTGSTTRTSGSAARPGAATRTGTARPSSARPSATGKPASAVRKGGLSATSRNGRKPALTASGGFRGKQGTKKRG